MLSDDPSLIPLGENGLLHNSYPTNSYVKGMARAEMVYKMRCWVYRLRFGTFNHMITRKS